MDHDYSVIQTMIQLGLHSIRTVRGSFLLYIVGHSGLRLVCRWQSGVA
jgi:hypothetical protein